MRKDFLTAIVVTGIAMAVFYYLDRKPSLTTQKFQKETTDQERNAPLMNSVTQSVDSTGTANNVVSSDKTQAVPQNPEGVEQVQKKFSEHLKEIGQCLQFKNAVDSEKIDPTFDNLIVSLRPALGEVVVQMDDWTQRDLRSADGELIRIRTETDFQNATGRPVKRVQLYKLNGQNNPELQNLDPEKSVNPEDSYIDTLSAGASTFLEEKGGRAYYQEGEELVIIERNGKVESISLSKGSKTVSCSGLDSLKSSCQCL